MVDKKDNEYSEKDNSNITSSESKSKLHDFFAKALIPVISFIVIAMISWAFGNFTTKLDHIEKTIAAHHGPHWETIGNVVAVGNLRSEFLQAKQEYIKKLEDLEQILTDEDSSIKKLLAKNIKLLNAFEEWSEQADKVVEKSRELEYEAYAHLTTHAPGNADVALINTAHIGGTRFNTGENVKLINTSSGRREQATVKIVSAYTDLDNTDVLVQIAQQPATLLGLSRELGRIKVIVKKLRPEINDPNRWKPISELVERTP